MEFDEKDNIDVKKLLAENQRLLIENNALLRKMRRDAFIGTIFKVIWFAVLIGVPIYAYFNYILPNWENLQEKIEGLENVTAEMEGAKDWLGSFNIGAGKE